MSASVVQLGVTPGPLNVAAALRLHYSQPPLVEPDDPVHLRRNALVMRCDQRRAAFTPDEAQEFGEHGSAVCSSRLPVGSSARTSGGLFASARATATRCCSPPDSLTGDGRAARKGRARRATAAPARAPTAVGAAHKLRKDDILDRVELGQQVVELVDEAEQVAAKARAALVVELGRFLALRRIEP